MLFRADYHRPSADKVGPGIERGIDVVSTTKHEQAVAGECDEIGKGA